MNIPTINLPSISTVTQTIAVLPEVIRDSLGFAQWDIGQMIAQLNGEVESDDHDHMHSIEPLHPWQAGRIALEITMLIRSHREFPEGHHEAMHRAVEDIDNPQHSVDVLLAMGSMLAHVASDEQIAEFGSSLTEAEARQS